MKLYELTYFMPIDLSEEATKSLQEKINSFITESQGALDRIETVIKKRLNEPIKKHTVAQMNTLNFYMAAEKIIDLEKKIKAESQIIRYIILYKKPRRAEAARRIRRITPTEEGVEKPAHEGRDSLNTIERPKKVEIKEIEKKLEEILGE